MVAIGTRLSESKIWAYQQSYYDTNGLACWNNTIPFYATSNNFVATGYTKLITAIANAHPDRSITVVELGAGCGQFSYLMIKALASSNGLAPKNWHYVMTDFTPSVVQAWRSHAQLADLFNDGILSSALLDVMQPIPEMIRACLSAGPVVLIANYLVDSLPANLYHYKDEQAYEVFVDDRAIDGMAEIDFDSLQFAIDAEHPVVTNDPVINSYRSQLLDSYLMHPTAILDFFTSVVEHAAYPVFCIAADKAYVSIEELDYLKLPELTGHDGCFSTMVNFDAMGRWCEHQGGSVILPSQRPGLKTALFALNADMGRYGMLGAVADAFVSEFTPANYLFLYREALANKAQLSLESCLSYLSLSQWDPTLFEHLLDRMMALLNGADMLSIHYLLEHVPLVIDRYYRFGGGDDLWFKIGVFYHHLKQYFYLLHL